MNGYLITFEGLEGAGKSTQISQLKQVLKARGVEVVATREPGGTPLAEKIRSLLLDGSACWPGIIESLLFSIARASHVRRCIRPALKEGKWVICDRYIDTTRAYQGGGRAVSSWWIELLIYLTTRSAKPNLTIVLDMLPEQIKIRLRQRSNNNRFDNEQLEFFERARRKFHALAKAEPDRIHLIDATLPLEEVERKIHSLLEPLLENRP